ncbi:MAG TPA: hypothetical protein VM145_06930 [Sphingomicrobium sp.]|nr:hypothetical protein [Sphingomicrobium sp.]
MRSISLLLIGAAIAGCSTAPPPPAMRTAQGQEQFQRLLAGKVAGPPTSCLPSYRASDMRVIDEDTVIFRQSANRVYLGHFAGGCNMLGQAGYALVTRQVGSSGLCSGDIATVVDTHNGFTVGSCVIGDFVPYTAG